MNPRQRRGAILIGLAAIGALAVFVMVANYVAEVRSQVGPVAQVVQLRTEVAPFEPLTEDVLTTREVPERWLSSAAVRDVNQVLGLVAPVPLAAGVVLQDGMLTPPPEVAPGQREISILVDAETGVAGRIGPGSVVDIVATFAGGDGVPNQAYFMVQNALILEVGIPTTDASDDTGGQFGSGEVVPVTFALTDAESLRLAYVESFASRVRLVLKSPMDDDLLDDERRRYLPDLGDLPAAEDGDPVSDPLPAPPSVTDDEDEPDADDAEDEDEDPDEDPDEDEPDEDDDEDDE